MLQMSMQFVMWLPFKKQYQQQEQVIVATKNWKVSILSKENRVKVSLPGIVQTSEKEAIPRDQWFVLLVTFDGITMRVSIDKKEVVEVIVRKSWSPDFGSLYIGGFLGTDHLEGRISTIRMWERCLDSAAIYGNDVDNMIARWHLDFRSSSFENLENRKYYRHLYELSQPELEN